MKIFSHRDAPTPRTGVLFAEDFSDSAVNEDVLPPEQTNTVRYDPSPPSEPEALSFTAGDIDTAHRDGFEEGRNSCLATESSRHNLAIIRTCETISAKLGDIAAKYESSTAQSADAVSQLIFTVLSSLLPNLCAQHAVSEISATIQNILSETSSDTVIAASVSPMLLEDIRKSLGNLLPEFGKRIVLVSSDTVIPGDAVLNWNDGKSTRVGRRVQDAVADVLETLGIAATPRMPERVQVSMPHFTHSSPVSAPIEKGESVNA